MATQQQRVLWKNKKKSYARTTFSIICYAVRITLFDVALNNTHHQTCLEGEKAHIEL